MNDPILQRAVSRSFEIIGEASKKIPDEFKKLNSDVERKGMAGMKRPVIYHYMGVNYNIVWDVISFKIPSLHKTILDLNFRKLTILVTN